MGALRREEAARRDGRRLQGELAGLKDLLDEKEQDVQRTRMIIRLKDARLEVPRCPLLRPACARCVLWSSCQYGHGHEGL